MREVSPDATTEDRYGEKVWNILGCCRRVRTSRCPLEILVSSLRSALPIARRLCSAAPWLCVSPFPSDEFSLHNRSRTRWQTLPGGLCSRRKLRFAGCSPNSTGQEAPIPALDTSCVAGGGRWTWCDAVAGRFAHSAKPLLQRSRHAFGAHKTAFAQTVWRVDRIRGAGRCDGQGDYR